MLILHKRLVLPMAAHGSYLLFVRLEEDIKLEVFQISLRSADFPVKAMPVPSPLSLNHDWLVVVAGA